MVKQYEKGFVEFFLFEEYVKFVCDQFEVIFFEMIVYCIIGDGLIDFMVGLMWSVNKWSVLNVID